MRRGILSVVNRLAGYPLEVRDSKMSAEALVVLGAPNRKDGTLSAVVKERVEFAAELWKKGVAPILVMTGGAAHGSQSKEAPAMAAYVEELGVPAAVILVEDRSTTTYENACFTATMLRKRRVRTVCLVSQPFHLRRARRLFRLQGLHAHAHCSPASIQYREPLLGLRWVLREYAAWLVHFVAHTVNS